MLVPWGEREEVRLCCGQLARLESPVLVLPCYSPASKKSFLWAVAAFPNTVCSQRLSWCWLKPSQHRDVHASPSELLPALMPHVVRRVLAVRCVRVLVMREVSRLENVLYLPFTFHGLAAALKLFMDKSYLSVRLLFLSHWWLSNLCLNFRLS